MSKWEGTWGGEQKNKMRDKLKYDTKIKSKGIGKAIKFNQIHFEVLPAVIGDILGVLFFLFDYIFLSFFPPNDNVFVSLCILMKSGQICDLSK